MDFKDEQSKKLSTTYNRLHQAAYERCALVRQKEAIEKQVEQLDQMMKLDEATILAIEQSQRDFDTWVAVKKATESPSETSMEEK